MYKFSYARWLKSSTKIMYILANAHPWQPCHLVSCWPVYMIFTVCSSSSPSASCTLFLDIPSDGQQSWLFSHSWYSGDSNTWIRWRCVARYVWLWFETTKKKLSIMSRTFSTVTQLNMVGFKQCAIVFTIKCSAFCVLNYTLIKLNFTELFVINKNVFFHCFQLNKK